LTVRVPYALTLTSPYVRTNLVTSGTSSTTVNITAGGTSIFSSQPSLASGTVTNVGPASMSGTGTSTINDDTVLVFSVTAAGSGAAGLKVTIYFTRN